MASPIVKKVSTRDKFLKDDLLDRFHPPDKKVCDIIATHPGDKLDPFFLLRPKPKQYLDYSLSQTEAKMDCGPTKIHYQEVRARYEPFPEDYVPPVEESPRRKHGPQHGRGPIWLYMDEVYKRKVEKLQAKYKKEMEERLHRKAELARLERRWKRKQRKEEEKTKRNKSKKL